MHLSSMPSPNLNSTASQRRGTMMRQLSLQSPSTPPSAQRARLTRQASEEAGRCDVQVTGTGWGHHHENNKTSWGTENTLRGSDRGGRSTPPRTASRPKPVKMAWGDRRQESVESVPGEGVEVVAHRCAGLPRPPPRITKPPSLPHFGDSNSLVLTRQQLAERLRRAWQDRDRKPNLSIVLAHSRPDSAVSGRTTHNDSEPETPKTGGRPVKAKHLSPKQLPKAEEQRQWHQEGNKVGSGCQAEEENTNVEQPAMAQLLDFKMFPMADAVKKFGNDFGSKQFQMMRTASLIKGSSVDSLNNNDEQKKESYSAMNASARRASFRSSQLLNKTITGSFSDDEVGGGEMKINMTKTERPPLQRTFSAPTSRSSRPASPVKPNRSPKYPPQKKAQVQPSTPMDVTAADDEETNRSTASRRKLKATAVRRKPKEPELDSSDEEDKEGSNKKAPRRRQIPRPVGDIITMVSLVSPAESDIEDPPTPEPLPPWSEENKENDASQGLETNEITSKAVATFVLQKCVASRKTTKTVSFQSHPPLVGRSCSASFPLRRVPPGAPIIIPTPMPSSNTSHSMTAPIFHSDNHDNRGVKRRLVRSRTAPTTEDDGNVSSDDATKTDTSTEPVSDPIHTLVEQADKETEEIGEVEPEFKTAKEKECWLLYKKMVEKGVAVSYETVLRGMLTPTEYRVRKNQLLAKS